MEERSRAYSNSVELAIVNSDYRRVHSVDQTINFSRGAFILPPTKRESGEEEEVHDDSLKITMFFLLFFVGICAGFYNGLVLWCASRIMNAQVQLILLDNADWGPGMFYFAVTTVALSGAAAYVSTKAGSPAVFGSGMPEIKALLAGDFIQAADYTKLVSFRILVVRTLGLVLAMGAGLSIGGVGPLVHISTCTAYVLMKIIPEFGDVLESPSLAKQVFAAAAAVGVSSVFNAPIGGLLFSVEVTSSFYLMTNYWKSFMAATAGSIMYHLVQVARGKNASIIYFEIDHVSSPYEKWELIVYVVMGIVFGWATVLYLRVHQKWFLTVKKISVANPIYTAMAGGLIVSILIYVTGAYSSQSLGVAAIVKDAFTDGSILYMKRYDDISRLVAITITFFVRLFLVLLSTNLRIPAGLFLPLFCLGSIFGRFWGVALQLMVGSTANIYIPGYAIVGAVAFLSGVSQTISAAVIAIEITGETEIILPCLIAAVIASGISKMYSVSIYDQGMINKGLESMQLLLMESGGFRYASDVSDEQVIYTTRHCTVETLTILMEKNEKQTVFPVVSNTESMKLIGSVARNDIYEFLKNLFAKQNVGYYIEKKLPNDTKLAEAKFRRQQKKVRIRFKNGIANHKFSPGISSLSLKPRRGSTVKNIRSSISSTTNYVSAALSGRPALDTNPIHTIDEEKGEGDSRQNDTEVFSEVDNPLTLEDSVDLSRASFGSEDKSISTESNISRPIDVDDDSSSICDSTSSISTTSQSLVAYKSPGKHRRTMMEKIVKAAETVEKTVKRVGGKTPVKKEPSPEQQLTDEATINSLLEQAIDVVLEPLIPVNAFPFTAHGKTPMEHVYVLFEMVKVPSVFVVGDNRRLEGLITKEQLLQTLRKRIAAK